MRKNVILTRISDNIFKVTRYKSKLENRKSLFIKDVYNNNHSNNYDCVIKDGLCEFIYNQKVILKENRNNDTLSFAINKDDGIYGLGIHQFKPMNRRNTNLIMLQYNGRSTAVPFLTSTGGYAILIDSTSYMNIGVDRKCLHAFSENFDNGEPDLNKINFFIHDSEEITYYVILGDMDCQIKGYRYLTGKACMLPKWSYGYFQSREHYKTQDEIIKIGEKFREIHFPIDCIVQDWNYWGDLGWNALRFDKKNYPNVSEMFAKLHSLDLKVMVSVWPSFGKDSEVAHQLMDANAWIKKKDGHIEKWGVIHDPYNPKGAQIFWDNMNEYIFKVGGDAWWLDSTEPGADVDKCSHLRNSHDCYLGSNKRYLNSYGLMSCKNVFIKQKEAYKDKRVYILTRTGYASQQEYAISTWTGDITASWACLKRQINSLLSFSMSGIPYSTTDIGGFFVNDDFKGGCENKEYQELYTRWFWFGVFSPLFRSHGTSTPREPWFYSTPYYESLLKACNLRYALMPYFYSLAYDIYKNDKLFIKPLSYAYPNDMKVRDIQDSYMVGDSLLVCNITEYQKREIKVYLPKGDDWVDISTGISYQGGQIVTLACPIDMIPILVKQGSIVLTTKPAECIKYQDNKEIDIRIYGNKSCSCFYYDDHGDNYDYENNDNLIIDINYDEHSKTLTINKAKGNLNYRLPKVFHIYHDNKLIKSINYLNELINLKL